MEKEIRHPSVPSSRAEVDCFVRELTVEMLMLDDVAPQSINAQEQGFLIALGANSIDVLELIITVEERLGFEFDDDELNADLVATLNHFVSAICGKLGLPA
jgi:acyl carrier protein